MFVYLIRSPYTDSICILSDLVTIVLLKSTVIGSILKTGRHNKYRRNRQYTCYIQVNELTMYCLQITRPTVKTLYPLSIKITTKQPNHTISNQYLIKKSGVHSQNRLQLPSSINLYVSSTEKLHLNILMSDQFFHNFNIPLNNIFSLPNNCQQNGSLIFCACTLRDRVRSLSRGRK